MAPLFKIISFRRAVAKKIIFFTCNHGFSLLLLLLVIVIVIVVVVVVVVCAYVSITELFPLYN